MEIKPWTAFERELAAAVEHDDLDAVIAALAKRGSGAFAVGADPGTAKGADIMLAARLIRSHVDKPGRLYSAGSSAC